MQVFLAATNVALTVPLVDKSGNALNVDSVSYRVTDQDGMELVARTVLDGFVAGSADAIIPVAAGLNTLAVGQARGLRNVELLCISGGNTVLLSAAYVVEASDPLVAGVNSMQTYAQAEFVASSIPNLTAWDGATEQARIAALLQARDNIVRLSFTQLNSNVQWGQDSLNYVPEGSFSTQYINSNGMFLFNGNLELITQDQFSKLPVRFLDALKKAQVVEADSILGGNPIEARRKEGVMLESIGEVKQMFRPSKPLELPVSRRALAYLSYYVTFAKRIGRA